MHLSTLLTYYKREDIRQAMLSCTDNREVAIKYGDNGFGKRPDILKYARDILELVKKGASSFHCSEEHWQNPLQLNPGLKKSELDSLRIGWDLVLDIDCPFLEYSKFAADLVVQALKYHGIKTISVKFSGNHGFHIAVPFGSFPKTVHGQPTKDLFPEGPKRIALYLTEMIRPALAKKILEFEPVEKVIARTGKKYSDIVKENKFDPFAVLDIDTILISSRHMYRMPYSFNEKSGLVSTPILPENILNFNKDDAKPENVKINLKFLDQTPKPNEAKKLIIQAFDFSLKQEETKIEGKKEFDCPENAVPEDYFPPCIKTILKGLKDGRKRALFVLVNFLTSCGWDHCKTEELLKKWNQRHEEPLRDVTITGQLRYHKANSKKILPPNCANKAYYLDLQFCTPDNFCKKIKNPVNYAILKQKLTYLTKNSKNNDDVN